MQLPIQAQPVTRKGNIEKINHNSSMVCPQGCVSLIERLSQCDYSYMGSPEGEILERACRASTFIFCAANPAACCK